LKRKDKASVEVGLPFYFQLVKRKGKRGRGVYEKGDVISFKGERED